MKLVYNATNSIEANLILGQLEQSGIHGRIAGEHLQGIELLDGGGLVKILVTDEDFESAKKIIDKIELCQKKPEGKEVHKTNNANFKYFCLGGIVGILIVAFFYYLPIAQQKMDRNGDGKFDEKATYVNYQLSRMEYDRNFDGKADFIYTYYRDGSPKTSKSDENFDGTFETKAKYRAGNVVSSFSDTTRDGFEDYQAYYKHGVVERIVFLNPKTKKAVKVQHYRDMRLYMAQLDSDGDGKFDITYNYDILEEIIK